MNRVTYQLKTVEGGIISYKSEDTAIPHPRGHDISPLLKPETFIFGAMFNGYNTVQREQVIVLRVLPVE